MGEKFEVKTCLNFQFFNSYRCPVDTFVFPELGRSREGDALEARFNAFKIPESNFLVFEATVKTCRDGCQPAYCNGAAGRSEPSFGRRKRSLNDTDIAEIDMEALPSSDEEKVIKQNGIKLPLFQFGTSLIDYFAHQNRNNSFQF